ncbi:MAG TPA: hypothetical protein VKA35_04420 [Solirubrobacterales bacterium]|nr:hypothetical protein [Solirubrobacterales bacterium]
MDNDQTPINARPKRRSPEALEDLSLALRDRVLWPLGDRFLALGDSGRAAVAGGAVVLALAVGVGGYSLVSSENNEPTTAAPVAVTSAPAPEPARVKAEPKPEPEPTLQGAAPVFEAPQGKDSGAAEPEASESAAIASTSSNTGNAATDTISSKPGATTAARASTATESVDGPPAGPAAIAVARKFAGAFVVYETGAEKSEVRQAFKATAAPEVTKALLQRPPRQPAGVEVPKAKVLNVVPAPSHEEIYPVSVSLLRVGATSELRLELEQLKNKDWQVVNVLG